VAKFSGYEENPNNFLTGENRSVVLVSLVEYGKIQPGEGGWEG